MSKCNGVVNMGFPSLKRDERKTDDHVPEAMSKRPGVGMTVSSSVKRHDGRHTPEVVAPEAMSESPCALKTPVYTDKPEVAPDGTDLSSSKRHKMETMVVAVPQHLWDEKAPRCSEAISFEQKRAPSLLQNRALLWLRWSTTASLCKYLAFP
jgi:hypothetical protein